MTSAPRTAEVGTTAPPDRSILRGGSGESPVFPGGRDRSIPVPAQRLAALLRDDPRLNERERRDFGCLQKLLAALLHHEYHGKLDELKALYLAIDPDDRLREDSDEVAAEAPDVPPFLDAFETALVRANYQALDSGLIQEAVRAPNQIGPDYRPDFEMFDVLRVYVRGRCRIHRKARKFRNWFRSEDVALEAYRRVVIALKFKADAPLDDYIRPDVLYLRMYRDVPFAAIDMHLPEHGTRVRMRWSDRAQIASPIVTGLPTLAAKLLFGGLLATVSPIALASVLAIPVGAGIKSFFGFRQTKRRHLHYMIRHLYYLTQANNGSVFARLIDSAEEEEFKEALLAYTALWRRRDDPGPWDSARLDAHIEAFLASELGIDTDFEVDDAVAKALRLGIVRRDADGGLHALTPDRAIAALDALWKGAFPPASGRPPE